MIVPGNRRARRTENVEARNLDEFVPDAAAARAALEAMLRVHAQTRQMLNSPGFARRSGDEQLWIRILEQETRTCLASHALRHQLLVESMDEFMAKIHELADRERLSRLLTSNTSPPPTSARRRPND